MIELAFGSAPSSSLNPICLGLSREYRETDTRVVPLKIELLILVLILYKTFRRVLDQVLCRALRLEIQGSKKQLVTKPDLLYLRGAISGSD